MKTTWISIQALERRFGVRASGSGQALAGLGAPVAGESSLSGQFKAMLALAISIAAGRPDDLGDQLRDALGSGASRQEILEVIEIAALMGGDRSVRCGLEAVSKLDDHAAT